MYGVNVSATASCTGRADRRHFRSRGRIDSTVDDASDPDGVAAGSA